MKKSLLIGLSTTAVTIGIVGLASIASAQTSSKADNSIVNKIATKFNLKKADVQAVFDTNRTEHETERRAKEMTELDSSVSAGTITRAQADQFMTKQAEMRTFRGTLKDRTETERQIAMKLKMAEFKKWATDNKIPSNLLKMMHGGHRGQDGIGPARTTPANN